MNQNSQLDLHPDAESLSAFAEHALPEQEQNQVLTHLAVCSRCREILYVARQAEIEDEMPVHSIPQHHIALSWWGRWRFIWIPAATCAAFAVAVVTARIMPPKPGPDIAIVSPQDSKTSTVSAPTGAGSPPAPPVEARKQGVQHADTVAGLQTVPANRVEPGQQLKSLSPQSQISGPTILDAAPSNAMAKKESDDAASSSMRQKDAAPAPPSSAATTVEVQASQVLVPEPPQVTTTISAASVQSMPLKGRNPAGQSKTSLSKASTASNKNVVTAQAATELPAAESPEAMQSARRVAKALNSYSAGVAGGAAAQSSGSLSFGQPSSADEFAARNALNSRLPSGLAAVSTAALRGHLLAIDPTGSVFLSEDLGKTWTTVIEPWKGRAVRVRATRPAVDDAVGTNSLLPAGSPDCADCDSAKPVPPVSAGSFELVTEDGSTWTSADGRVWRPRSP